MAVDNDFRTVQVAATEDLSADSRKFKACTLSGTIAATPLLAGGILRHGGKSGETITLGYSGLLKALFGGAVNTVGYPLTVTTSGFIIAASSGGQTIGRSRFTCASGDLQLAFFDFKNLGYSTVA